MGRGLWVARHATRGPRRPNWRWQASQPARMVASSAASAATAVGLMSVDWTSAAYSLGATTPVSIRTDRAPTEWRLGYR